MKLTVALISFLLLVQSVVAQNYTISGYLTDESNGEGLIGAALYVPEIERGTTSNLYGFYSLSMPAGTYTLTYSFIGYKTVSRQIELDADQTINIEFTPGDVQLTEVEITTDRPDENVRSIEMSVEKLDIKTIRKVPQFMGEVDVIRTLQLLPGVSTVGEGAMGFNVRGGNVDQNLILLDEAPVFN